MRRSLFLAIATLVAAGGCTTNDTLFGDTFTTGAGGVAGAGGTTTSTSSQSAAGGSGGGGGGETLCVSSEHVVVDATVDIYIMLDRSGSTTSGSWATLSGGVDSILDAMPAGTGVALDFFPYDAGLTCPLQCTMTAQCGAGCGQCVAQGGGLSICEGVDACQSSDYETPTFGLATLPDAAAPIVTAMSIQTQNGGSPLGPVIEGSLAHARQLAVQSPTHEVVVLLATDWDPTICSPLDSPSLAALAAAGLAGAPSVRLFAAGAGPGLAGLDSVAAAGGTEQAYVLDAPGNQLDALIKALLRVGRDGRDCSYGVPPDADGEIEVAYKNDGGEEAIPQVDDQSACNGDDGWYLVADQVVLCRATCGGLEEGGAVEISAGCSD